MGLSQNYPKILALGMEFEELKKRLLDTGKNAKEIQANNEAFIQKNKELLLECQGFIHGTLGVEEYNEIFAGRKPNSVEHYSCGRQHGFHRTNRSVPAKIAL